MNEKPSISLLVSIHMKGKNNRRHKQRRKILILFNRRGRKSNCSEIALYQVISHERSSSVETDELHFPIPCLFSKRSSSETAFIASKESSSSSDTAVGLTATCFAGTIMGGILLFGIARALELGAVGFVVGCSPFKRLSKSSKSFTICSRVSSCST